MITLEKEISISRLYEEKGDLYCRLGEYNEAIKDYKEAIKFGDKLDIVDFGGAFYSTTGSYDDVDCASEWGVNGEMPYIKIGDAYCELKEYDNAIAYYLIQSLVLMKIHILLIINFHIEIHLL